VEDAYHDSFCPIHRDDGTGRKKSVSPAAGESFPEPFCPVAGHTVVASVLVIFLHLFFANLLVVRDNLWEIRPVFTPTGDAAMFTLLNLIRAGLGG
jgi:hypothetical protein